VGVTMLHIVNLALYAMLVWLGIRWLIRRHHARALRDRHSTPDC